LLITYARPLTRTLQASLVLALLVLSACGTQNRSNEFYDPYEAQNRKVHEFNIALDKSIVRPVAQGYGHAVPEPARIGFSNFAGNLALPGMVLNDLLQVRLEDALFNSARFLFNSTIGLAGVFDPASTIGVTERSTDFGATLHRWGVGEGHYVELPLFGPSTERDTIGMIVNAVISPINLLNSTQRDVAAASELTATVGKRYQFTDTIDSVLYDSADSYAQARLLYLQSRRHELGDVGDYTNPNSDPYEDPYAQ